MAAFDINDLKGLKYYLSFAIIVLCIYVYSMMTGWRYLSFNESSNTKGNNRTHSTRTFYHK